jgi:hypothetical protein
MLMFVPATSKAATRSSTDSSKLIAVRTAAASAAVITDRPTDVVSITCVAMTASTPTFYPYFDQQRINDPIVK